MINIEDILNRDIEILKDLKKDFDIKESLFDLIFYYDRLILNKDLPQKRIRLIGVLSSNQNSELEQFYKNFKPILNYDIVMKDPTNIKKGLDFQFDMKPIKLLSIEKNDTNKKETRKQIYVLKKSSYETLKEEEISTILSKLELFRIILRQTRLLKVLFDEEQIVNIHLENRLGINELNGFNYNDFVEKIKKFTN